MSRHLIAKFRREAAADDGWQHMALPHTVRSIKHFNRNHGDDYPGAKMKKSRAYTKLVNHGEQRYALEVMDSPDGQLEWSLHRQVGPDISNPDHWERLGVPRDVHPFCNCIGEGGDEADLGFPAGGEDGYAGMTDGGADVEEGIELAKADAEQAFHDKIGGQGHGLDHHNYDDLARGLDEPEEGYDIFGERS